ncbi:MAG TPA: N-acetylmuramoyl-L-alanine amidase [Rectinemataceae bacterium]|nr:N-acetylmuramoyl-L-alanine amidase [Rectinemataceae bacterium]
MKAGTVLAACLGAIAVLSGWPEGGAQPAVSRQAPDAALASPVASAPSSSATISLSTWLGGQKARLSWDPLTASGWIGKNGDRLAFAVGLPLALWDFSERLTIDPPVLGKTGPLFSPASLEAIGSRFGAADAARASHFSIAAILIDPGHGGKDTGAVGEHRFGSTTLRVVEKDIALKVGREVRDDLAMRFPDKRILLSREGDTYPTLEQRVAMANSVDLGKNEAIIYVSIHANASFNKTAKGFEIWYLNPEYRRTVIDGSSVKGSDRSIAPILNAMLEEEFTTESIILARDIDSRLQQGIGASSPNRGIRAEEWFVVRNAKMPSVLVEMGFVTNPEEAKLLSTDDYLKKISDGIYTGLVDFVSDFEKQRGPADK